MEPVALYEVARLFGTLVAETILASVHVRAHQQAGHMDASDLIKALQCTLRGGGRPHMVPGRRTYPGQPVHLHPRQLCDPAGCSHRAKINQNDAKEHFWLVPSRAASV